MVKRKLALLGATGSIGSSTFEVAREQSDALQIAMAAAAVNYEKLLGLAEEFDIPLLIFTQIKDKATQAKIRELAPRRKIYFGEEELLQALKNEDYDISLNAIGASAGLSASHAILSRGKPLALANKESLVMAGHLLRPMWLAHDIPVIPVDSEHSAIFQAIGSHPQNEIRKIHITASGGAFLHRPLEEFATITPQEALRHPNWDMGAKVTLDSATMVNKALEVMEAHWLFGMPWEAINAVIHPTSIVHSMVEFIDGSYLAQLSNPDMKLPILYALSWPQRWQSALLYSDPLEFGKLEFLPIEKERYPLFYLGLEAARAGGIMPTVYNAANEAALQEFLEGRIGFCDIYKRVARELDSFINIPNPDLETVLAVNRRLSGGAYS